jgi:NitT/TauT family transport system substrate-binding protein
MPKRFLSVATVLALATTLSGCNLLGGDSGEESESGNGNLETASITVSIMKTTDLAPFHLARQKGYFEDEGLEVEFVDGASGGESTNKLISGEVEIAYSSYTPFFLAESRNAAQGAGGVKIIADASSAGPNSCVVVALPASPVKSVRDLENKRVAITAPNTISDLLVMATMKENGLDYKSVQWVQTPFPQTADRLMAGEVDAAFATEPFIKDTERRAGAVQIVDVAAGPTADLPTAGWASTGDFVKENPKTIAAFQRAMQRGTELALSDRALVEPMLVEFSGVDEETAKNATLLDFQSKLDAERIQRVPDLMREFEVIPTELDAASMIVPTAALK